MAEKKNYKFKISKPTMKVGSASSFGFLSQTNQKICFDLLVIASLAYKYREANS